MKHKPIAPVVDTRVTGIEILVIFAIIILGTYLANQLGSRDVSSLYLLRFDRIYHIVIGFIIGLSMRRGLLFAATIGLGKECWDHFFGTGFDTLEVFITGFGGVFGYLVRPVLSNFIRRKIFSARVSI